MWEVHYRDGTYISSEHTTPWAIEKRHGVLVIIQTDTEHNWVTVPPYDYYMWDARGGMPQWYAGDINGLFQYLSEPGSKCVLMGTWVDKYLYRKILDGVVERMGEKQGYNASEYKP